MKISNLHNFYFSEDIHYIVVETDNEYNVTKIYRVKYNDSLLRILELTKTIYVNTIKDIIEYHSIRLEDDSIYEFATTKNNKYFMLLSNSIEDSIEDYFFKLNNNIFKTKGN